MSRLENDMTLETHENGGTDRGDKKNIPNSPREFPTRPKPSKPDKIPERRDPFERPSEIPLPPKEKHKRKLMKRALLAVLIGPGLVSCSTTDNNKIDKTKPLSENIKILERLKRENQLSHAKILAPNLYIEGSEKLESIREMLASDDAPDYGEVYNELNEGIVLFKKADKIADKRFRAHKDLVNRRHLVLDEGVKDAEAFYDHFKEIDDDLRRKLAGDDNLLAPADAEIFKERYKALQAEMVVDRELSLVENTMDKMRQMDLDDQLPTSFDELSDSYDKTVGLIEEIPERQSHFRAALESTYELAVKSSELTEIVRSVPGPTTEKAALIIWSQRKKISKLKNNNNDLSWNLAMASGMMDAMSANMITKQAQVEALRKQVSVKLMANQIRSNLKDSNVEVLAKDDKVIVKFVSIPYDLNQVRLPKESKPKFMKVATILNGSQPKKVLVKGHTDTVGSNRANAKVARLRADDVKKVLDRKLNNTPVTTQAVSYNEPIKPNVNNEYRRINRRVDLVIYN